MNTDIAAALKTLVPAVVIACSALACPRAYAADAADAVVTPLMTKALSDYPGKEVYVLEGSVVMQVKGGKEVTLTPGQTFYEGPNDIHVVGRNASKTKPAKFLVVFIKKEGAPILTPVQ